ncbi:cytochrome c [Pseudenhygromyxa sp. WMMC2535]|uniref:c-type cytochrome n=1 Tax=Pseudenhygromyxa sp. WMMC2535 TaxID=2712867 RepID=UPI0015575226|nr:cytochrome c [Pseudenhygromyxa sp. WMMC2535]NVB36529.1 cytochrome c [Pseudenhygromyxa sp. WMMC2535]
MQARPAACSVFALMCGACVQSSAPTFSEPMTFGEREVSAQTLNEGRDLYFKYCVSCHGETGAGDGPAARNLKFPPRDFRTAAFSFVPEGTLPSHEALVERIRSGVPERGMPPWTGMREDDLSALADFIKTFSPRWKAAGS